MTTENTETFAETTQVRVLVKGEQFFKWPQDLYIPPDALEIFLEAFEGPLDLLLYLIKKQNLDILDIPVAEITRQYMSYIQLMQGLKWELAAEYLVMAAMLAEIKSRMLLPKSPEVLEEEDPRADLVKRLQEYERYKLAAESLDALPRKGREFFDVCVHALDQAVNRPLPDIKLDELVTAFQEVLRKAALVKSHHVQLDALSVREQMVNILSKINSKGFLHFSDCFDLNEGRLGVVVSFVAILELIRESMIDVVQAELFAPIYIKARKDD